MHQRPAAGALRRGVVPLGCASKRRRLVGRRCRGSDQCCPLLSDGGGPGGVGRPGPPGPLQPSRQPPNQGARCRVISSNLANWSGRIILRSSICVRRRCSISLAWMLAISRIMLLARRSSRSYLPSTSSSRLVASPSLWRSSLVSVPVRRLRSRSFARWSSVRPTSFSRSRKSRKLGAPGGADGGVG